MNGLDCLSADFKPTSYWIDDVPLSECALEQLPRRIDVVVIGAGYTGLSAALTLARAGRQVLIIEALLPGQGASTANAGNISPILKKTFSLVEDSSADAIACCKEAVAAFHFTKDFIALESLHCQPQWTGRFYAAHSSKSFKKLTRIVEPLSKHTGLQLRVVTRAEQQQEVGSEGFFGGLIVEGTGRLHPGLYHKELLKLVSNAGVQIASRTRATKLNRSGTDFKVTTSRGEIAAKDVFVATNGYTDLVKTALPYFRRRVVPVSAYGAMSEEISSDLMMKILPSMRTILETKTVNFYLQPSPDHKRLFLGGHTGRVHRDMRKVARAIHAYGARFFVDLQQVKISHCWTGKMAFTFDYLPHAGVHDGVHYAIGMCATGVTNGLYLGHKVAMNILGDNKAVTAFHRSNFPTSLMYSGKSWFMPLISRYHSLRDSFLT